DAAVRERIPQRASTLHRLLGTIDGSVYFRHNAKRPLPVDVLVVDEASMVALPLMAKLFDALPPDARVILLGDRDQLASVEAGAALGDIADAAGAAGDCAELAALCERATGERWPNEGGGKSRAALSRPSIAGSLSI